MSVFTPFRNPAAVRTVVLTGALLKLVPTWEAAVHAQQPTRVDVMRMGGVNLAPMPWICDNSTGVQSTVIYITSTQTQVVAGSTKIVYVCGWNVFTGASSIAFKWVEGSSTDCITGQADKSGLYDLSSRQGFVVSNGGGVQFKTSSGFSLCIDAASSGLQGQLTFISST